MVTLRRTCAVKRPQRPLASGAMRTGKGCVDEGANGKLGVQRREREIVDGGRLAGDAVVVHGVDAVGGDVHLKEVAVPFSERVDAFDGDAAEGEVVGELPVGDGERWEVVAEPVRKNLHESTFLV